MATIVPAILETTKDGFNDQLSRIVKLPGVERVQVDFGDGQFVESRTLGVTDMDVLTPTIHFEAHLMAEAPMDFLDYQICGFKTIIVHYEAYATETDLLKALKTIKEQGLEAGLALKPETNVQVLQKFANDVKTFLILSVHPGFQGAEFLPQTYERIAQLRKLCPNAIIEADGGLNEINIKQTVGAGADLLVVGSALVKSANINDSFQKLQELV
jgi:ribulose-phosphate 3-epimerase